MPRTLCAAALVLILVCVACGRGGGTQPTAEPTPQATSGAAQQPTNAPDLANEGFESGDSGTLEPSQGESGATAPDEG